MKLDRKKLRKIIIEEIEKSIDEDSILKKDDYPGYGMQSQHNQGHAYRSKCAECGSAMDEGQSICEACGYGQHEEETRKEYGSLNEGGCGCGTCASCEDNAGITGDKPHHAGDSYMARPQLAKIAKYASKLLSMIDEGEKLQDWQESHIAQLADDIGEVYHSIEFKKYKGEL